MNRIIPKAAGLVLAQILLFQTATCATAASVTFEDLTPTESYTGPGGGKYWNGSVGSVGFTSGGVSFSNSYNSTYGSWDGWAYSNTTDTTIAGFTNQYSAYTGGGYGGSGNYGVYCEPWSLSPTVELAPGTAVTGAYFTNTTYAALSMLNGDSFAKEFGGDSGSDPDWFKLTITGLDALDAPTGLVEFYLADYRFTDNARDYIIDVWSWVDLTDLGNATKLAFDLSSSDNGDYGMNTPGYFALDNLTTQAVSEPSTLVMLGVGALMLGSAYAVRKRRPASSQSG